MSTPKSPGWYAAPDGTPGEQWWNGASWSEARRLPGATGAAAPAPSSASAPSYGTPIAPPPGVSAPPPGWTGTAPDPTRPDPYAGARAGALTSYVANTTKANQPASMAVILGFVSLFFGIVGIGAIIAGVLGLAKAKTLPAGAANGRTSSFIGIGLGTVGILIGVVPFIVAIIAAISGTTFGPD